jgi:hypothetical protein
MRGAWFVALCACGGATQPTPPAVATATRDASTRVATVATVAPVTASYSAPPCYRLDADGAGATLSCGKDSWRWSRVPPLEAFVFSPDSMLFALVANAANRFDVRVMSINGSVQSDASLAGEASGASFVRRGAVVEIEERSNARAWVDVMTGAQTSVADAAALPSRHAVETLLHARWEALGAKRIELATPEATPPFPSAHHDVTFYFYAESLSGGGSGPADAMPMTRDSSIWGASRASAHKELATVGDSFGDPKEGERAPGSVSIAKAAAFERDRDRIETTLVADTFASRAPSEEARTHYCAWLAAHPALAKTLRARHAAFIATLACP